MKTLKTISGLTLMALLSFSFTDGKSKKENNKANEESIGLVVYGKISNKEISLKNIHFNLYEGTDLAVSGILNKKGEFELPLYRNNNYVIEFLAKGFLPKRFLFNTDIPISDMQLFFYGFSVELLPENLVKGADIFILDFPMAIVSYNFQEKSFDYDKKYSSEMKSEEKKAIYFSQIKFNSK